MNNRTVQRHLLMLAALVGLHALASGSSMPPASAADQSAMTAGRFLQLSLMSPRTLMRTSSFLGVERVKKNLQIAIVLDGTDSMGREIEDLSRNLASLLEGLQVRKSGDDSEISVAIVVYRDELAPSGAVTLPIPTFTADIEQITTALSEIHTETGNPYFAERVDLGLAKAIDDLPWTEKGADASRWIVVCGDAPPYPENSGEKHRQWTTDALAQRAKAKEIEIYAILANSGFKGDLAAENQRLNESAESGRTPANRFFGQLASVTSGQYLSMWDTEKVHAALDPNVKLTESMPKITQGDIAQMRDSLDGTQLADAGGNVKLAVLPHAPLERMSFDAKDAAVQFAVYARHKYDLLPGINISELSEVEKVFSAPVGSKLDLPNVARQLDVDYLVWGSQKSNGEFLTVSSGIYSGLDVVPIASAESTIRVTNDKGQVALPYDVIDKLRRRTIKELSGNGANPTLVRAFETADDKNATAQALKAPLAEQHEAQTAILVGMGFLRKSLASVKDSAGNTDSSEQQDGDAAAHLTEAIREFKLACALEPDNPFAHLLLANCYFNLARYEDTTDDIKSFMRHLLLAYQNRDRLADLFKLEIEAEYALLVKKDVAVAIAKYQELADTHGKYITKGDFALRAHWMLAGIYLGDWGVRDFAPELVNVHAARDEVLKILAIWPRSEPAEFYQMCQKRADSEGNVQYTLAESRLPNQY